MVRFKLIYLLSFVLLSTAGCSKPDTSTASAPAPTQEAESAAATVEADDGGDFQPAIYHTRLLEPGAEPRQTLRFQFAEDRPRVVSSEFSINQSVTLDGNRMPEMPAIPMTSRFKISPLQHSNGTADYELEIVEVNLQQPDNLDPPTLAVLQQTLSLLTQIRVKLSLNDRGQVTNARNLSELPEGADALGFSLEQFVDAIGIPLPEEPVGVGASWAVSMNIEFEGIEITQEAVYTLDSESDDGWIISSSAQIKPTTEGQVIEDESRPGLKIVLQDLQGDGSSLGTLILSQVIVPRAQILNMAMEMQLEGPNSEVLGTMAMRQQIKTTLTMVPDEP